MHLLILFLAFGISPILLLAQISLDKDMSKETMRSTGIDQLSDSQKKALEAWINDHFELKEDSSSTKEKQLSLSLNVDNGKRLELSNGTYYEIAPEDRLYSSYWITPFPVELGESTHPGYPIKITNLNSGTSVNGKRITKEQFLQEDQSQMKQPQPIPQPKVPEKPKPKPPSKTDSKDRIKK